MGAPNYCRRHQITMAVIKSMGMNLSVFGVLSVLGVFEVEKLVMETNSL